MSDHISTDIKPRDWMGKLSHLFRMNPMEDYEKNRFSNLHFDGSIFDWWKNMEWEWDKGDRPNITTWNQFLITF